MRLQNLGANKTIICTDNGEVCFSYNTPVCATVDGVKYKTNKSWSRTTSKHIGQFGYKQAEERPQEFFDKLL
jgi:carbamate kinase